MNSGLPPVRARIAAAIGSASSASSKRRRTSSRRADSSSSRSSTVCTPGSARSSVGAGTGPRGADAEQRQVVLAVHPLLQQADAVLVEEVQVLEHDQHRAALAEAADQPAEQPPQAIAALERVELAGLSLAPARPSAAARARAIASAPAICSATRRASRSAALLLRSSAK
jgi:hypothetical protein